MKQQVLSFQSSVCQEAPPFLGNFNDNLWKILHQDHWHDVGVCFYGPSGIGKHFLVQEYVHHYASKFDMFYMADDVHLYTEACWQHLFYNTSGRTLLLTAPSAPKDWPVSNQHLRSRIDALMSVAICYPSLEDVKAYAQYWCRRYDIQLPQECLYFLARFYSSSWSEVPLRIKWITRHIMAYDQRPSLDLVKQWMDGYDAQ